VDEHCCRSRTAVGCSLWLIDMKVDRYGYPSTGWSLPAADNSDMIGHGRSTGCVHIEG
jgi:allophanate hydrolase subunit 2